MRKALFYFFLALFLVLPFQGSRPLMGRDEYRYPEVAREMLKEGDFLIPHFEGRIHLTKPPLTYWAIAISYKLFGVHPFGARLPNAVAFSLTVMFVFLAGRELWGEEAARSAALIYLSMLVPFAAANIVTTDTLLVMWEAAAIWAFLWGLRLRRKRAFLLMWLFWALGFMTKGTAILPVASGTFLFWWLKRKELPNPFIPEGVFIFLVLGLSWYFYVWFTIPGAWHTFWVEQIYGRLFSDTFHRNSKWYAPFYLYLPLLTLGALPASLIWVKNLFRFSWQNFKKVLKSEWQILFLTCQFTVPLLVFWFAKSRLPLYILPLFVPLALLTSRVLMSSPISSFQKFLWGWLPFLVFLKWISSFILIK